jgi:hypothetical protein
MNGSELRIVDGLELNAELRRILRPGELVTWRDGRSRRLPRWFMEVPSWIEALEVNLSRHFKVWELVDVDLREHEMLRVAGPRYLPLAACLLANALEVLRTEVGTYIHIAANGGYRSPAHGLAHPASPHCWGTAANIYRIGDDYLNNEHTISRYGEVVRSLNPLFWTHPYGHGPGQSDDHLHVDIGYTVVVPHDAGEETDSAGM